MMDKNQFLNIFNFNKIVSNKSISIQTRIYCFMIYLPHWANKLVSRFKMESLFSITLSLKRGI